MTRLYERVVESEARDGEREREVKSSLERVMHAMQTEIKQLKENQDNGMKLMREEMINMMPVPKESKSYLSNDEDILEDELSAQPLQNNQIREADSKEEDDDVEEENDSFHTETDGE